MNPGCDIIKDRFREEAVNLSEEARGTGREHAMSICRDGSFEKFEGSEEGIDIDRCDDELLNIHTHPEGNPVTPSVQDIGTFLMTEEGDYIDRMCILGVGESPKLNCLMIDRSTISNEEYTDLVNDMNETIKGSDDIPDIAENYPDFVKSCDTWIQE